MATPAISPVISAAISPTISPAKGWNNLSRIVVAHDFSNAAERAMADAMALATRFDSEITIAYVDESGSAAAPETNIAQAGARFTGMEDLRKRADLDGYHFKEILRSGEVASTLFAIGTHDVPNLLLLGAYGHGVKDRETLGSTAEQLLRSIPCPVLTYGPRVNRGLFQDNRQVSILLPLEFPCDVTDLTFALNIAKLFKATLEVVHVVDIARTVSMPHGYQHQQCICDEIVDEIRRQGIEAMGSLIFGKPDAVITAWSREHADSFILIPLQTRPRLSSKKSDNVAVSVIRNAEVPVMTYRPN